MSLKQKRGGARAALAGTLLFVAIGAHANPTGPQVVSGSAAVTGLGTNSLTVTNSANAVINWQGFSIGAGERANFVQPSASSAVLNRVVGQNISTIAGQLLSNGRVFLTNPNGVLITSGAQINAASFTATTSAISNADFLAGNTQSGPGSFVSAEGLLTVTGGDLSISTSGVSTTGNIDFGGGGNFSVGTSGTVDLSGGSLNSGNLIVSAPSTPVGTRITTTTGSLSGPGTIVRGGTVLLADSNVSTAGTLTVVGGTLTNTGGTITSNTGTITLTSQQGSTGASGIPATTPISTPVPTARPKTSIQSASTGTGALTAGRNVVATAANVVAIAQPAPAAAPASATLAAAPRSSAVGATISLQKREPMF